jgi:flagellar motor switch protein FliG
MAQETAQAELNGLEKASLLLISLGSKAASSVLQHLSPDEVQRLCVQVAKQKKVDESMQEQVIEEFERSKGSMPSSGGLDFARELLEQAVGASKAEEFIAEITAGAGGRPFDWAKGMQGSRLANALQQERPQVIALVLAHLGVDQAADIISQLPPEIQGKVAYRLTCMQPVDREVVKPIELVVKSKVSREGSGDLKAVGGLKSLVSILNSADRSTEQKILEYLDNAEQSVAESIRQMMFVFEDITKLDDRAIQIVIRELDQEDLRLGLKGAGEEIRALFFKNMSERAAGALKEDLEMMGPVKRKDVESAQHRVVSVIRRLDESGDISLRSSDEDVIM